jgi:hypothetical protein
MKTRESRLALVLGLSLLCLSAGCPAQPLDEATMGPKESALNKVVAALEAAVVFKGASPSLTEEQLLAFAVQDDPAQLDPFKDLRLRVRRNGPYSSVLVCTADGKRALLEDAGCTPKLDGRHWDKPPVACEFRLDLVQACRKTQ